MNKRRSLSLATLIVGFFLTVLPVQAATVPSNLLYEGRILDGSRNPVTSAIVLRFSLWQSADWTASDASGSTINTAATNYGGWYEVQTITPSSNGIVSVQVGSGTALPTIDFTQHKYFQVEVKSAGQADTSYVLLDPTGDAGADTVDRRFIGSVAYAKNAESVQNRTVGTSSGKIVLLGSEGKIGVAQMGSGTNTLQFTLNAGNAAGDATLTFGNSLLTETLKFSESAGRFEFSDDVLIQGNLTMTGSLNVRGNLSGSTLRVDGLAEIQGNLSASGAVRLQATLSGASTINFSALKSCDTIDTDINGLLSCGNDSGAGGGLGYGDIEGIFVNQGGDTMTGNLVIGNSATLSVSGSIVTEANLTLNDDQTAADTVLTFGSDGTNETLTFANTADQFEFSDDLKVNGSMSGISLTVSGLKSCSTIVTDGNGNVSCGGMVTKTKAQNQSVTDSNLVESNLSFTMGTNETWVYVYDLDYVVGVIAADSKFAVTAPPSSTCHTKMSYMNAASEQLVDSVNACGQDIIALIGAGGGQRISVRIYGDITTGGTSGSGMLLWAQNTTNATANTLFSGSTLMAFKTVGSDVAEIYHTQDLSIVPGTVVSIDPNHPLNVRRSQHAYEHTVLGVISTKPGFTLGGDDLTGNVGIPVFLALAGRVPVMVSAENGPIQPGDLLTTSSTQGVAMRATKAGPVIGKALSAYNGTGIGVVTVFVDLSDWPGPRE